MKLDEKDPFSRSRKFAYFTIYLTTLSVLGFLIWIYTIPLIENHNKNVISNVETITQEYKMQIMEFDGCEYLVYDYKNITHKGNCKYCWERKH